MRGTAMAIPSPASHPARHRSPDHSAARTSLLRPPPKGRPMRSFTVTSTPEEDMKKIARNLILAGIAWRLIARRRAALARERRARRIAPLLVTAGGAGLILVARPRIVEGARRIWDEVRRQISGETRMSAPAPRRDVVENALTESTESLRQQGQRASSVGPRSTSNTRALAATAPDPGVRRRKRTSRPKQPEKSGRKSAYGVKNQGDERSEPPTDPSLKH